MSPTDKGGNTPESPETPEPPKTPEPNGQQAPSEAAPFEPITDQESGNQPATDAAAPGDEGVDLTKPDQDDPTLPAAPLGGAYPAPESFASASATPPMKKNKIIAIVAAGVIVVLAVVAVLLVVFLNNDDGPAETQVQQVTQEYLDAVNSGQDSKVPALLCQKAVDNIPTDISDIVDVPAREQQVQIDNFDTIKVDGDTATAKVTLSVKSDPSRPAEQAQFSYVNEDGWKICL